MYGPSAASGAGSSLHQFGKLDDGGSAASGAGRIAVDAPGFP